MADAREIVLIGKGANEENETKIRLKFFPEHYMPGPVKSKKVMITAFHEHIQERKIILI